MFDFPSIWGQAPVCIALLLCGVADAATIQTALTPATTILPEIIVTAEKRGAENVQLLPSAITVLDAETMLRSRIQDFRTLQDYVPNLNITDAGGRATFNYISIRGFRNADASVESSAVIMVDGVPNSDFYGLSQQLFEVERVEVMKGPQGTLYGLNSQSGVISIHSRKPGNEFAGRVWTEMGGHGTWNSSVHFDVPLIRDVLTMSLSGAFNSRDGFTRNLVTGDDYDEQTGIAGRVRIIYTPVSELEFDFIASARSINDMGGYLYVPTNLGLYSTVTGTTTGPFEHAVNYQGYNASDASQFSLQSTLHAGFGDVVSMTAFRQNNQAFEFDADMTPSRRFIGFSYPEFEEFYQEIRFQSRPDPGTDPADQSLQWTTGVSFDMTDRYYTPGLIIEPGNPLLLPPGKFFFGPARYEGETWGVFGQATKRFRERRFGVTLGLRYDHARRELMHTGAVIPFLVTSEDFTGTYAKGMLLPKLALDWRVTPQHLLYVSAARGWNPGGVNPQVFTASRASFREQTSWAFELGSKSRWFKNSLQTNLAGFYTRIDDYQDLIEDGLLGGRLGNANRASLLGFEVETKWRPTGRLEITGTLGYVRAQYDDYLYDSIRGVKLDGRPIQNVPSYNYSLIADYRMPSGWFARGELVGGGDYDEYQYNAATGVMRQAQFGENHLINLRLGYERERWGVYAFVNNLMDCYYFATTNTRISSLSPYTDIVGVTGPRRVAGMGMFLRF